MSTDTFNSRIIEYVFRELQFVEKKKKNDNDDTTVDPEVLSSLDALHYCGNLPICKAIQATSINKAEKCRVLDINSGLASPARMLTHFVPYCQVDAYNGQLELHKAAQTLTRRCGLAYQEGNGGGDADTNLKAHVKHLHGDYACFSSTTYDAMMSFMGIMYVKDRRTLFRHCAQALSDGGRFYVEDLVLMGEDTDRNLLTADERELLTQHVGIDHNLPTLPVLLQEYTDTGFSFVEARETTTVWMDALTRRLRAFTDSAERHERVHGNNYRAWQQLDQAVLDLLRGGHVGGIAYTVEKG
mmetsp:Transcript_11919/g.22923  ORF Transcript_11919/g.22923 Transcript_11919/m.22923 type:complete len:299 (+) Transcript_11919:99-995(+)|eukprot:scaffold15108_cov180-Amphora_coffeaeformis.AAC.23